MRLTLVCAILLAAAQIQGATTSLNIKIDTFGYRTTDPKFAVFSANPGASVELRDTSDVVQTTLSGAAIVSAGADNTNYSGDTLWHVDFSSFTTPGTYRLYSASLNEQSYDFEIRDDIYNAVGKTALKTYYYQRCNTAHPAPYAGTGYTDNVACHMGDATRGAASGQTDYGTKDLTGGWHDAGDYNKYVWYAVGDSILHMLTAYEDNPGIFIDADLNIPESGNGRADILDEVKYELDWLLKMQLGAAQNYAVLERVRETSYTSGSPPSANNATTRGYFNPNLESGAMFVGSLAMASRIFAAEGDAAYAATLLTAAKNTWTNWLSVQPAGSADFNDKRCWAAAELFRADQTVTTAEAHVRAYLANWNTFTYDPDYWLWVAALAYIQTPSGTNATTVSQMRARYGAGVNAIFATNDKYRNGMSSWQHYWGSNRPRAKYGLYLLQAAKIGQTGSYTATQCRNHALDFLHYFHGQNAASMTYLTNMKSLGGDHSSYMFYHLWFGASGTAFSVNNFMGKPAAVVEPHYPYYSGTDNHGISDNRSSTYGPAPGFIPGGPNSSYTGTANPPGGITFYNKAYRDWAWQQVGTPKSWEITENSISAQGPYVALSAYFMAPAIPFTATPTPNPAWTATHTPTFTPTPCAVPINGCETLTESGTWAGSSATRSIVDAATAPPGAVTQGSNCLRVQVNTGASWNDLIMNLSGFSPNVFAGAVTLSMDLHMDATLAGGTYNSLFLVADCGTCPGGKWYRDIAPPYDLVAGNNQVVFNLDFSLDTDPSPILPTDPISTIRLIHNRSSAATGVFHLDNIRLTGVCWTPTPSRTPSPTRTPTRTPSVTRTPTPSITPTLSFTPTQFVSPSPSSSVSPSRTPTLSPSPSFTITPSWTFSPVYTPTRTLTASASATRTVTPSASPTLTVTPSTTPTLTTSPSASPTFTVNPSASPTVWMSPSPTVTRSVSPSPAPTTKRGGPPKPRSVVAAPNPQGGALITLSVDLEADADSLQVQLYTQAMVRLATHELRGPFQAGWNPLLLPGTDLANGLYYVRVTGRTDSGEKAVGPIGKLVILR